MNTLTAYLARCALAFDILLNTVLGGDVETISSRMGRALQQGRPCLLCRGVCRLLDLFWPGHCLHNIMNKVNR